MVTTNGSMPSRASAGGGLMTTSTPSPPRMFRSASVTRTAISMSASRCLSRPVISQSTQMMRSLIAREELEVTGTDYRAGRDAIRSAHRCLHSAAATVVPP